jgi:hypothetical protein
MQSRHCSGCIRNVQHLSACSSNTQPAPYWMEHLHAAADASQPTVRMESSLIRAAPSRRQRMPKQAFSWVDGTVILLNTSLFAKRGCILVQQSHFAIWFWFVQVDHSLRSTKTAFFFWVVCLFACLSVLFYFNLLAATEDITCAHDLDYFILLRIFLLLKSFPQLACASSLPGNYSVRVQFLRSQKENFPVLDERDCD